MSEHLHMFATFWLNFFIVFFLIETVLQLPSLVYPSNTILEIKNSNWWIILPIKAKKSSLRKRFTNKLCHINFCSRFFFNVFYLSSQQTLKLKWWFRIFNVEWKFIGIWQTGKHYWYVQGITLSKRRVTTATLKQEQSCCFDGSGSL